MKRKLLAILLIVCLVISIAPAALAAGYGDTADHWAESSIERWSGHGIIQGSNGLFDPNGQLTCAQLATILAKLLKLPAAKDAGFTDNTADAWYYDAINRCAAAGILNGNGDGTVTPEAPISRERAMVMLARALGIEPIRKPDLTKYTDAAQVSAYAQGYVAALIEAGIVGGVTADELAPQDNINRASTVTILDRAISTYADKAGATVKADGKGIVLVVAENVKITGAPEGTKIVVADGATGLTVNGKSVSDDQTYIVPKTTTGSGSSSGGYSHSHNWVDNYCAGCNQFKDTVVAAIGTKGYETLAAAVAAAHDGDTVKLVKDITLAQRVEASFNGTIDLNGRTLTSTETCKNGSVFHVASGTLTIKNGSMIGVSGPTGWTDELYKKECDAITVANGATVTLEDLSISICSQTGACVYVFDGGKAYITSGTYINDTTEFDANGTTKAMLLNQADNKPQAIFVSGGTFKGENPANGDNSHNPSTFLAAGYKAEGADNIWTVSEDTSKTYCAQVGNGKYETLAAALAAAKDGDTVKLVDDVTLAARVDVAFTGTIDLNGHPISSTATCANGSVFNVTSGTVTIKNGSIVGVAGPTGWTEELYKMECDAITVCSGAIVNLEELNISICSRTGACVYAFDGGTANVKSGTYSNNTTEFDANGTTKAMLLNQVDSKPQAIFVTGGQFHGENPANGDNSGNPSTFLAEGYEAVGNEGKWTVKPIFAGGSGTAEDPFVIQNAEQLKAFRDNVNAGNTFAGKIIKLAADIDLAGEEWAPIGTAEHPFSGTFDGNGKTITGLTGGSAKDSKIPFALIGYGTGNVTVKNLTMTDVKINSGEYASAIMGLYIGAAGEDIATYAVNFENITVNGLITGTDKPGAILGCTYSSSYTGKNKNITFTFDNCLNNADISGSRVGGIAGAISGQFAEDGNNNEVKIVFKNCVNTGDIKETGSTYKSGGIVGWMGSNGNYEFNNCSSTGTADGDLFGRFHYAGGGGSVQPTSNPWNGVGLENGFGYLNFTPQVLTIYDCYSWRSINVYWQWKFGEGYHANSATYYVGKKMADDDWRLTINGTHYRAPFNTPINGTADCTPDTEHINNDLPTANNWSNNGYILTINDNQYTYTKDATGGQ